jgi:hypothetical protein
MEAPLLSQHCAALDARDDLVEFIDYYRLRVHKHAFAPYQNNSER